MGGCGCGANGLVAGPRVGASVTETQPYGKVAQARPKGIVLRWGDLLALTNRQRNEFGRAAKN